MSNQAFFNLVIVLHRCTAKDLTLAIFFLSTLFSIIPPDKNWLHSAVYCNILRVTRSVSFNPLIYHLFHRGEQTNTSWALRSLVNDRDFAPKCNKFQIKWYCKGMFHIIRSVEWNENCTTNYLTSSLYLVKNWTMTRQHDLFVKFRSVFIIQMLLCRLWKHQLSQQGRRLFGPSCPCWWKVFPLIPFLNYWHIA